METVPFHLAGTFYLAIACYVVAAILSLQYVRGTDTRVLFYAKRFAAAGNTLLLFVFVYRWWSFGHVPFTGLGDPLNLFLVLSTGIILLVQRNELMRPVLCYYLPALGLLALVTGVVGPSYLGEAPRELNGLVLTVHVGLVFLSFALFFVASLTAVAYLAKATGIKKRQPTGFARELPSLEQLDRTLYRLIGIGYPAFVATSVLGLAWAFIERDLLGEYWFISPKIRLALAMAIFYSVSFHLRRLGLLRGPKLAYVVFFGFAFLLAIYLTLGVLQMSAGTFWGDGT